MNAWISVMMQQTQTSPQTITNSMELTKFATTNALLVLMETLNRKVAYHNVPPLQVKLDTKFMEPSLMENSAEKYALRLNSHLQEPGNVYLHVLLGITRTPKQMQEMLKTYVNKHAVSLSEVANFMGTIPQLLTLV